MAKATATPPADRPTGWRAYRREIQFLVLFVVLLGSGFALIAWQPVNDGVDRALHRGDRQGVGFDPRPARARDDDERHAGLRQELRGRHRERLQRHRGADHLPVGDAVVSRVLEGASGRARASARSGSRSSTCPRRGAVPHRRLLPVVLRQLAHRGVADRGHPVRRPAVDLLGAALRAAARGQAA